MTGESPCKWLRASAISNDIANSTQKTEVNFVFLRADAIVEHRTPSAPNTDQA